MKGKFWGDCILLIQNNRITIGIPVKQWEWNSLKSGQLYIGLPPEILGERLFS